MRNRRNSHTTRVLVCVTVYRDYYGHTNWALYVTLTQAKEEVKLFSLHEDGIPAQCSRADLKRAKGNKKNKKKDPPPHITFNLNPAHEYVAVGEFITVGKAAMTRKPAKDEGEWGARQGPE